MKKTSRILAMLLALVMVAGLCACGSTDAASAGSSAPAASSGSAPAAAPADDGVAKTNRVIGTNQLLLGAYPLD
ncbi:MAG: hypothetical protein IJM35_03695, partial [Bacteroidales bacterium]|nr:hypothetical protein [Bacteroidales bacterium]